MRWADFALRRLQPLGRRDFEVHLKVIEKFLRRGLFLSVVIAHINHEDQKHQPWALDCKHTKFRALFDFTHTHQ